MIEVKNLEKSFGDLHILKGITTTIEKGEKVVIIGPSGSGKSTFLYRRCKRKIKSSKNTNKSNKKSAFNFATKT